MKIGHIDLGEKPLFLAPMEDVTDASFRFICKEFGADLVDINFGCPVNKIARRGAGSGMMREPDRILD